MVLTTEASVSEVKIGMEGTGEAKIDWGDGECEDYPLSLKSRKRISHQYADSSDSRTITISGVDVSGLSCYGNKLTELNVSENKKLWSLNCRKNKLTSLDVNRNIELSKLNCSENKLTRLNAGENPELFYLICSENQLTNLYMGKGSYWWYLDCSKNQLANLNIPGTSRFNYLFCQDNKLDTLDVRRHARLKMLDCSGNRLTDLYLRKNTTLELLDCSGNQLSVEAMNDLLDDLHENPIEMKFPPDFAVDLRLACIANNPGTDGCNTTDAVEKGWTIRAN
jgi:hypothetical protein